jgi:isocitrate dehydrogenase kinase/phosphatase
MQGVGFSASEIVIMKTAKKRDGQAANLIYDAFNAYRALFKEITRRAQSRFRARDWQGMRKDSAERLSLYKKVVDHAEDRIRSLLEDAIQDKKLWSVMKSVYSNLIAGNDDWEIAESFFNSVSRRVFTTVGVDPKIEFVNTDYATPPNETDACLFDTFTRSSSNLDLIQRMLSACPLLDDAQSLSSVAGRILDRIEMHLDRRSIAPVIDRVEMLRVVFYRGMGAYLIGRICAGSKRAPLAIALLNQTGRIVVDAVLTAEDEMSVLFSFTRAYFHVEIERPHDLVQFLRTLLPHKRIAELYISLGFNKHGKTELYRELLGHLSICGEDRFDLSPGKPGMVMIVFNMPTDDLVFKLIRDRFDTPKKTTRQEVMQKYDLVFRHDRAGRLVDAQSFEYLEFDQCCFSEALMDELVQEAGSTVDIRDDRIVVNHAYVERRVTPLDLFLAGAEEPEAREVVIDWGYCIKNLAVSNIFPGDILLKNFGVTRLGRVVFYDYDEICPLTSCNIRKLPDPTGYDDELASEPWFFVDDNDVFPEEFRNFLGLPAPLAAVFLQHHADLFAVDFWLQAQQAIQAGNLPHIYPYANNCRIDVKENRS